MSLRLDYREKQAWPLTSATTCYTGARHLTTATTAEAPTTTTTDTTTTTTTTTTIASLSTERHSLTVHLSQTCPQHQVNEGLPSSSSSSSPDDVGMVVSTTSRPLVMGVEDDTDDHTNSNSERMICVGFASLDEWQATAWIPHRCPVEGAGGGVVGLFTGGGGESSNNHGMPQRGGSNISGDTGNLAASIILTINSSDDASVTVASTTTTTGGIPIAGATGEGGITHRKSGSIGMSDSALSTAAAANVSSLGASMGPADVSLMLQQQQTQSAAFLVPQAKLVLTDNSNSQRYVARLDYRPLAPTIFRNMDRGVGVWIGSADDCKLRLYQPAATTSAINHNESSSSSTSPDTLLPVELIVSDNNNDDSNNAFTFLSPIMALDCCSFEVDDNKEGDLHRHVLAVACQDGTIRLITFDGSNLTNVQETTMIVDGPIVCVSLHHSKTDYSNFDDENNNSTSKMTTTTRTIHCVVGSLCGYVCEVLMMMSPSQNSGTWDGPFLVAQGLWSSRLQSEDSVLCVNSTSITSASLLVQRAHHRLVAVGTYSGRCLVYSKNEDDSKTNGSTSLSAYDLMWECQLPYSIHGVLFSHGGKQLFVTTRRSAHLFQRCRQVYYDADLALQRLKVLADEDQRHAFQEEEGKTAAPVDEAVTAIVSESSETTDTNPLYK